MMGQRGLFLFLFLVLLSCAQKDAEKRSSNSVEGVRPGMSESANMPQDIQAAVEKLSSPDAATRMAGLTYLTKNANTENWDMVMTDLMPLLNDKNDIVRGEAVRFMLNSTDARWTPYAMQFLNDSNTEIRKAVLSHFLLHYGPDYKDRLKIGKKIRRMLLDEKEKVELRKAAAITYEYRIMGYERWNDIDDIKERIRRESPEKYKIIFNELTDSERTAQLREAMRNISSDNIEQKKNALSVLRSRYQDIAESDRRVIFSKIRDEIDNENSLVRKYAVLYLFKTGEPSVFKHAVRFLRDPYSAIRAIAVDHILYAYTEHKQEAIDNIDEVAAVEAITGIVSGNNDDELVRISACELLDAMGKEDLLLTLQEENDDPQIQKIIGMALKSR